MTVVSKSTICFILDLRADDPSRITIIISNSLILEARHLSVSNLPGHGPAGGVDQEVGELPQDVGQRHQGQEVDLGQETLPHRDLLVNL